MADPVHDRLVAVLEEMLNAPGTGETARAAAEDLACAMERATEYLRRWILRPGCCAFCGAPVDAFNATELRFSWSVARKTTVDGGKQGGRNSAPREAWLGIWMHRPCYDKHTAGVHPDQRELGSRR